MPRASLSGGCERQRGMSLGRDATVAQVGAAVARTQRGPQRLRAAEETYVRRLVREDTRRLEAAQFQRWKT